MKQDRLFSFGLQATLATNLNIHLLPHYAQEHDSQGTSLFLKIFTARKI